MTATPPTMEPWTSTNYSHSYREQDEERRLCFDTGFFGFKFNHKSFTNVLYKKFESDEQNLSYVEAIACDSRGRMDDLEKEALDITLIIEDGEMGKKEFRASSTVKPGRLCEIGKICQRYEFRDVTFCKQDSNNQDENLNLEECKSVLYVLVWPDSISFVLEFSVTKQKYLRSWWPDGFEVKMAFKDWSFEKSFLPNPPKGTVSIALNCNVSTSRDQPIEMSVTTIPYQPALSAKFSDTYNCFLLSKDGFITRSFQTGWTDIRDYDVFKIEVCNNGIEDTFIPIMLFVEQLANPTGTCPMICDVNFRPTGIPIQLSKNWHNGPSYGRFYALLPVCAGTSKTFHIRIAYGFYGTLPTASHANLSLIGYGVHGTQWEQLAIGCWGETFCMDMEMALARRTICDIRMLMTAGKVSKKWRFTDAGWGGDWLSILGNDGQRKKPFCWKTAYNSYGPCLTDVFYSGWYGADKSIEMSANVRTCRVDDYCRTFTSLSYKFLTEIPSLETSFFSMGGARYVYTPKVVYGNSDGLLEDMDVIDDMNRSTYFLSRKQLTGEGPWFCGFPNQGQHERRTSGDGWRALIIRSFSSIHSGKNYINPSISLMSESNGKNLSLKLSPPVDIERFHIGDEVKFDVELITLPLHANDYYGPNEAFRSHLISQMPCISWKTVHRELTLNNLDVTIIAGGVLKNDYPLIIAVDETRDLQFTINRGVGAIPMRFDNLSSDRCDLYCDGVKFEAEVHGNDYWQTDYDPRTHSFSHSFNVPFDGKCSPLFTLK